MPMDISGPNSFTFMFVAPVTLLSQNQPVGIQYKCKSCPAEKLEKRVHLRRTVEVMMGTGGKDERAVGLWAPGEAFQV